jgi:hypothetical protein
LEQRSEGEIILLSPSDRFDLGWRELDINGMEAELSTDGEQPSRMRVSASNRENPHLPEISICRKNRQGS